MTDLKLPEINEHHNAGGIIDNSFAEPEDNLLNTNTKGEANINASHINLTGKATHL